jgi:molecular chaperone DnaK
VAGRLGIDFGTSNTVVAVWDATRNESEPLHIPQLVRPFEFEGELVPVIPSLISYEADGSTWIGNQVVERNLRDAQSTFRWMKRYISARSPRKRRLGEREIGEQEAGKDYLVTLLQLALAEADAFQEEVVYTLPVESFEHYEDWVARVSDEVGVTRYRMIDEASAAALGYGVHIQPGDVYLVFDFGGGTLDVAIVLVENAEESDSGGQRCRVLGKAGAEIGGATIDAWLFEKVVKDSGRLPEDPAVLRVSSQLLSECERAKERLSSVSETDITATDIDTGATFYSHITRQDFEDLLDEHDALATISQTLQRALAASAERGYSQDHLKSVLAVGGSGLIPAVRKTLERQFGRDRVQTRRPFDAVARGAAAFAAGVDFFDHIQHDYALEHTDMETGERKYRTLLKAGTSYPTDKPLATVTIKATYDGQTQFGINIFELGYAKRAASSRPLELVFDPKGSVRLTQLSHQEADSRTRFWINEKSPTFLDGGEGARRGEACFKVNFEIDENKRLIITVEDLKTRGVPMSRYPVVRLS